MSENRPQSMECDNVSCTERYTVLSVALEMNQLLREISDLILSPHLDCVNWHKIRKEIGVVLAKFPMELINNNNPD